MNLNVIPDRVCLYGLWSARLYACGTKAQFCGVASKSRHEKEPRRALLMRSPHPMQYPILSRACKDELRFGTGVFVSRPRMHQPNMRMARTFLLCRPNSRIAQKRCQLNSSICINMLSSVYNELFIMHKYASLVRKTKTSHLYDEALNLPPPSIHRFDPEPRRDTAPGWFPSCELSPITMGVTLALRRGTRIPLVKRTLKIHSRRSYCGECTSRLDRGKK
jgi:hypothetical protein